MIFCKGKIDRRTREQAAIVCATKASNPSWSFAGCTEGAAMELGFSYDVGLLAFEAWLCAYLKSPSYALQEDVNAEAEAMLRTGWSPPERS